MRAKNQLKTSLGPIAPGASIPGDLPEAELDRLKELGAVVASSSAADDDEAAAQKPERSRDEMLEEAERLGIEVDEDTLDDELAEILANAADPKKLSKKDLIALAKERDVSIDESATKADIAAAINAEL